MKSGRTKGGKREWERRAQYDVLTPKLGGKYDALRPKAWGLWHHIVSVLILASMAMPLHTGR
ncbi:MAG: hypothetical protein KKD01_19785 [Proteobacteria bacterium]|nr:hypothetical protein [Pseudomonadota bacterium]